jgi:hypothetical protein
MCVRLVIDRLVVRLIDRLNSYLKIMIGGGKSGGFLWS